MQDTEPLHGPDVKAGDQQEEKQVSRVEEASLDVGHVRSPTIEMGIPEWQLSRTQALGGKAVGGPEEGNEIAAPGRHVGIAEDDPPEVSHAGQAQQSGRQHVPMPIPPAAMPLSPARQQIDA